MMQRFIFKPTTSKSADQPPPQKATTWAPAANGLNMEKKAESQPRTAPRPRTGRMEGRTTCIHPPQPGLPALAGHDATTPFAVQRNRSSSVRA